MGERLQKAPCGYISLDNDSCIVEMNKTFLNWLDYQEEDIQGKHIETILSLANRLILHSYFIPNINLYGSVEELFINIKNKAGESVPFLMNAKQQEHGDGIIIDCILLKMEKRIEYEMELRTVKRQMEEAYIEKNKAYSELQSINAEIEAKQEELLAINEELVELSKTDKLTGVPNRRYLEERLLDEVAKFHETAVPFSVLMIDIDHFKLINDTYGHQTGDQVLAKLAHILKLEAHRGDFTARYGGEEFTMILPGAGAQTAFEFAQRLNKAVSNAKWGKIGNLTISIGVAEFTADDTEDTIIEHADNALYASKENGRNRSSLYSELQE